MCVFRQGGAGKVGSWQRWRSHQGPASTVALGQAGPKLVRSESGSVVFSRICNVSHRTSSEPPPGGNVYGVSTWEYPNGGETSIYFDHRAFPDRDRLGSNRGVRGEAADPERSRAEAARRARARVRRMARMAELRYMWTLTFPDAGCHDLGEAVKLLTGWLKGRRHDVAGPGREFFGGEYVAVPELHPGGHGYHWHLLTNRRVPFQALQVSWTAHLLRNGYGDGRGHVRVHYKLFDSAKQAASYAAKYVSKTFDREGIPLGTHRYRVGDSLGKLIPRYGLVYCRDIHDAVAELFGDVLPEGARVFVKPRDGIPESAWVGW